MLLYCIIEVAISFYKELRTHHGKVVFNNKKAYLRQISCFFTDANNLGMPYTMSK